MHSSRWSPRRLSIIASNCRRLSMSIELRHNAVCNKPILLSVAPCRCHIIISSSYFFPLFPIFLMPFLAVAKKWWAHMSFFGPIRIVVFWGKKKKKKKKKGGKKRGACLAHILVCYLRVWRDIARRIACFSKEFRVADVIILVPGNNDSRIGQALHGRAHNESRHGQRKGTANMYLR